MSSQEIRSLAHDLRLTLSNSFELLDILREQLGSAQTLLRDVLAGDSTKRSEHHDYASRCSVRAIIEQSVACVRVLPHMSIELHGEDIEVSIARIEFFRVMLNVLHNAERAARAAGGKILIRWFRHEEALCIEVYNNVVESSPSSLEAAYGLGLSIIREFVAKWDGQLFFRQCPETACELKSLSPRSGSCN